MSAPTSTPTTQYTTTDSGVHIAYQVCGDGPIDLVFMRSWGTHVEIEWEVPPLARFIERLAAFSRVIRFDQPGTGLSDPVDARNLPTLEDRAEYLRTVLDARRDRAGRRRGGRERGSGRPVLRGDAPRPRRRARAGGDVGAHRVGARLPVRRAGGVPR